MPPLRRRAVVRPVLRHRLILSYDANAEGVQPDQVIDELREERARRVQAERHHGEEERRRSVALQFGGRDGNVPNCLPITPGWNYLVRLSRPRPEMLSGKWKFPEPQLVP